MRDEGQFTFNNPRMIVQARLDGFGLWRMPDDAVSANLVDGRLVRVLKA